MVSTQIALQRVDIDIDIDMHLPSKVSRLSEMTNDQPVKHGRLTFEYFIQQRHELAKTLGLDWPKLTF
jgi:hypothetical protein